MANTQAQEWPDNNPDNGSNIERLFRMFADGAMAPKRYKATEVQSVTAYLSPEDMDLLQVISCRLGSKRGGVAAHILKLGLVEAAFGCGFTVDEKGRISDEQKKWDLTQRQYGIGFPSTEEE